MQKLKRSDQQNSLRKIRVSVMKLLFLNVLSIFFLHYFPIIKFPIGILWMSWQHEFKCLNSQDFQMKFLLRTDDTESQSLNSLKQRKNLQATNDLLYSTCVVNRQPFITKAEKLTMVKIKINELFAQMIISCQQIFKAQTADQISCAVSN